MDDFYSIYSHGLVRVAACNLPVAPGDPQANAERTAQLAERCSREGAALAVFPELGISGYSIEDLLLQDVLLDATLEALEFLRQASRRLQPVLVVGAPLAHGNRLYNCAVVIHRGRVLGVVPKSYLPNYREFYEKRHFASGTSLRGAHIRLPGVGLRPDLLAEPWPDLAGNWSRYGGDLSAEADGPSQFEDDDSALDAYGEMVDAYAEYDVEADSVPFGPDLLFEAKDVPGFVFHVEVCEDMWVPVPPSARAALAGAMVLVNLSSSPVTIGRASQRELMVASASSRCCAAYVYTGSGEGESSTDLSWDGQAMIYEMGAKLAESERFATGGKAIVADVDLDALRQERLRQGSFDDNLTLPRDGSGRDDFRTVTLTLAPGRQDIGLIRPVDRFPFVPSDEAQLNQDCYEAYNIQVYGISQRLKAIGDPRIVIGVSGGLDSTHALIVAAKAMDRMGRARTDILAYTLPGFATSEHTKENARALCERLGVTFEEIDIRPMARQMLGDMGHPFARGEQVYDVTFENVQAGLRTDLLFRLAGANNAIVLGTGDLSELALGWCTFGVGDHMSHYNVNAGVPKTLMQHLIRWVISSGQFDSEVDAVLQSVLDTEISPELVPSDGEQLQSTQAMIGPYELQDFTLHHLLRTGARPSKIAFYAWHAWRDSAAGSWPAGFPQSERHEYSIAQIRHWMEVFYRRFFSNQFKRSTLPNGPKVSAGGTLSPRGDWRMPSDVSAKAWLAHIEKIPTEAP
ncbi:MAG: NAD(+) synthase [Actinomycetaceae bacterium]|nr:NAD(+) synthase [Actinomycetaceae bacterium]